MAIITIGIVASSREWRSILQAHVRDHVADVKVQILREPRMALELDLDVVVIDDVSSFLTRDKVVRLREKGTRVVGVYDLEGHEGLGIGFLENLGVDLSLPSNISPEEMINAVSQLQPKQSYENTFDQAVAGFSYDNNQIQDTSEASLIAVSGPPGTGATEIAIAISDLLVARRNATLLIDVDEVGPSVARRLGYHLHPNILSAIDTVSNATKPLTEVVGRPNDQSASAINFNIIPGIANPEDWAQLRSSDISDLFVSAKKSWRYIVCNTGPFAEDLSGYGMERFGATRAALEYSDVIIGVMSPTPTGYLRFLDWLVSLRSLGEEKQVHVVVNRTPKSSFVRNEIESQLSRDVDNRYIAGLYFVPEDEKVLKAEWEGQLVSKSPFLSSVAEIVSYAIPASYVKQNVVQQNAGSYVQGNQAYSGTPIVAPSYGSQPQVVSWDDPDIVNPQASVDLNPDSIENFDDIQESLSRTMEQSSPEIQPVPDDSQPYSFSPPLHASDVVEQINNPVQNPIDQGYVPAYKRDNQEDDSQQDNEFLSNEQNVNQPQPNYIDQEKPNPQQSGYVPGYVEEEKPDDNKFWGN